MNAPPPAPLPTKETSMSAIPSYTDLTREVSRNLTPLRTHNADVIRASAP